MAYYGTDSDDIIDQEQQKIAEWEHIYGKRGNDQIKFGNAIAIGGEGNDVFNGTSVLSTVAYWDSPQGVTVNLATGTAQDGFGGTDTLVDIHWIQGSAHDDTLIGSAQSDYFYGGGGNNTFLGGGGNDEVSYYFSKSSEAKISYDAATDTFRVEKHFSNGDNGIDILKGITTIRFSGAGSDDKAITKKNFISFGGFVRSTETSILKFQNNAGPSQFKSGDFNGDGHTDYVFVTQVGYGSEPSPSLVALGNGKEQFVDGTLAVFKQIPMSVGGGGRTITTDFNQDGTTDILQLDFGIDAPPYPGGVNHLYLSSGSERTLIDTSQILSQKKSLNHAASIGDMNGDSFPDVLVNSLSEGNVYYLSDAQGKLILRHDLMPRPMKNGLPLTATSSGTIDANQDGYLDWVIGRWEADHSIPSSQILINDGKGNFSNAIPINLPASVVPLEVVLDAKEIDINHDGRPDLMLSVTHGGGSATSHDDAYYNTAYIQLLINQGNGQFKDETALRLPAELANQQKKGWFMSLDAVDFDHDGFVDIIAHGAGGKSSSIVLMNQGDGQFKQTWQGEAGELTTLADANEDGMIDILSLRHTGGASYVSVELNHLNSGGIYDVKFDGHRLIGSAGNDQMRGSDSADSFKGKAGNDVINGGNGIDTAIYEGNRKDFKISKVNGNIEVADSRATGEGKDTLNQIERLQFADSSVNLNIAANAASIKPQDLQLLEELYVAFFNRVPDADGLDYWITQFKAGMSIHQIADSFYAAAILFTSLTHYSAEMSNDDFVRIIYKNVLGRYGETAPPAEDVNYWSSSLQNGTTSKGSLVTAMLTAAHTFKGDAKWGWVPDLLDNKIKVANYFAVQLGLNYNSAEESISKGMAIAAEITPSSIDKAIELIGINDPGWAQV